MLRAAVLAALVPAIAGGGAAAVPIGSGGPGASGTALAWIGPGAQPCPELCDARWTLDQMRGAMPQDVHAELARRIDAGQPMTDHNVASGDLIVAVSYARAGIPLVDLTRRVAQFPAGVEFPAHGHAVVHDGRKYRFVRVEGWESWALIVGDWHPQGALFGGSPSGPVGPTVSGIGGAIAGGAGGGGAGGAGIAMTSAPGTGPSDLLRRPVPLPVPLPGGLALLAGALAALGALRLRRAAARN